MHSMVAPIPPSHVTYSKEKEKEMTKKGRKRGCGQAKAQHPFQWPIKNGFKCFPLERFLYFYR